LAIKFVNVDVMVKHYEYLRWATKPITDS